MTKRPQVLTGQMPFINRLLSLMACPQLSSANGRLQPAKQRAEVATSISSKYRNVFQTALIVNRVKSLHTDFEDKKNQQQKCWSVYCNKGKTDRAAKVNIMLNYTINNSNVLFKFYVPFLWIGEHNPLLLLEAIQSKEQNTVKANFCECTRTHTHTHTNSQ